MKSLSVIGLSVCVAILSAPLGSAQAPGPGRAAGAVTAVDAAVGQVSLMTDRGDPLTITTFDRTAIIRIPPGETDIKKGSRIPLSSLSPGDRIVALGDLAADQKSLRARSILVMTRADLSEIQQKERADWQKRGTTGTVVTADPAAKTITIKAGARTATVEPSVDADIRRYAPDSARFSDAQPSSLAEIKAGDQMRVLGNSSDDGSVIKAEKIVFGTFRQIAATVTSVNPATGEIQIEDLAGKKPLTLRVDADSTLRRLPDPMARMLARRYQPGADREAPAAPPTGRPPVGRSNVSDIGQLLDRLRAMPLAELKPGDAIMVSTTVGTDPGRVTAVMLLAGVEPLLTASPTATRDIMSGWNLGGEGGGDTGNQ